MGRTYHKPCRTCDDLKPKGTLVISPLTGRIIKAQRPFCGETGHAPYFNRNGFPEFCPKRGKPAVEPQPMETREQALDRAERVNLKVGRTTHVGVRLPLPLFTGVFARVTNCRGKDLYEYRPDAARSEYNPAAITCKRCRKKYGLKEESDGSNHA